MPSYCIVHQASLIRIKSGHYREVSFAIARICESATSFSSSAFSVKLLYVPLTIHVKYKNVGFVCIDDFSENVMNLQVDVDKDVKLVLVSLSAKEQKQEAFLAKQVRYSSPQNVIMDCNIP